MLKKLVLLELIAVATAAIFQRTNNHGFDIRKATDWKPPPLSADTLRIRGGAPPMFEIKRTASYSCLNEAVLTEAPEDKKGMQLDSTTPPGELKSKIAAALTKDLKPQAESALVPPEERLRVVIVSSEVAPFSKSGGLADVCDKLGAALSRLGHKVMTIAPLYFRYQGVSHTGVQREFGVFGQKHRVEYWRMWRETAPASGDEAACGVEHVFVQHQGFERHGMYGHPDDLMRFALLSWAALEAPFCVPCQDKAPFGDDVVFLVNDWMVGLVPLILTSHYRRYGCYAKARTVFDIHNMGYWGGFPPVDGGALGLPDGAYLEKFFHDRQMKLLKGAIEMADRVVTVSPAYKDEILTPEGGFGLQESCRSRFPHLDGILNGIDTEEWNPETDHFLSAKFQGFDNFFSRTNVAGKKSCKLHLQSFLGLQQDENVPIVAFVGRLANQKGIDLLEAVFPWLMARDAAGVTGYVQLIMVGTGEDRYANFLRRAEAENKGRVVGYVGFTSELEHKVIAGADILIMPSRYEPCGLPQMYAQRYGTVPVVHNTGGLKDSVEAYDPFKDTGTGWKFDRCDPDGLKFGLWNALNTYRNFKEAWAKLVVRCMSQDFSWESSARKYQQIFNWAKIDPPAHQPIPFK